jgi:hypothetical protein
MPGKTAFLAFDHVGGEAMFFNAYAWIEDRTLEPWYRSLLLSELVDSLEAEGVSVGQTTNFSLAKSRREADEPVPTEPDDLTAELEPSEPAPVLSPSRSRRLVRSLRPGRSEPSTERLQHDDR